MRIVHILIGRCNPDSANGVEKTVANLCKYQGILNEVFLISLTNKDIIPIKNCNVIKCPPPKFGFFLSKQTIDKIRMLNADVFHIHSVFQPHNFVLVRYFIKWKISYVITPNGGYNKIIMNKGRIKKTIWKIFFEKKIYSNALFVHSVGDTKDILEFGVKKKVIEIPNGVEKADISITQNYKINVESVHKISLLFLGRLSIQHKGLDLLLNAIKIMHLKNMNFKIDIIGPDFEGGRSFLESFINKYKLENIKIWPPLYNTAKIEAIQNCDFFLHTSRWEGLPFSILEAASKAKALFVTPSANPLGLVEKYAAGIVVQPTTESIANGLVKISGLNDNEIYSMGRNALKMMEDNFLWEDIAPKLVDQYKSGINDKII